MRIGTHDGRAVRLRLNTAAGPRAVDIPVESKHEVVDGYVYASDEWVREFCDEYGRRYPALAPVSLVPVDDPAQIALW